MALDKDREIFLHRFKGLSRQAAALSADIAHKLQLATPFTPTNCLLVLRAPVHIGIKGHGHREAIPRIDRSARKYVHTTPTHLNAREAHMRA